MSETLLTGLIYFCISKGSLKAKEKAFSSGRMSKLLLETLLFIKVFLVVHDNTLSWYSWMALVSAGSGKRFSFSLWKNTNSNQGILTETNNKGIYFTCFMNCVALKSSLQPYKMCLPCFPCKNQSQNLDTSNKKYIQYSQEKRLIMLVFCCCCC